MFLCKSRFPHLAKVQLVATLVKVSTPCQGFYTLFLSQPRFPHLANVSTHCFYASQSFHTLPSFFIHIFFYVKQGSQTNSSESSILLHVYNPGQLFGFHIICPSRDSSIHLSHDLSRTNMILIHSCIHKIQFDFHILEPSSQNGYKLSFQYRPFTRQWSNSSFLLVYRPSTRK